MRQDTVVITTKGVCYFLTGVFMPWAAALAQWANSGETPSFIVWMIILSLSVVGGCNQLLSFLSNSFGEYKKSKEPLKQALDSAEVEQTRQKADEDTQILSIKSAARVAEVKEEVKADKKV